MSETSEEKLSRVRLMATGDPTWDLSRNDTIALQFAMDELDRLRAIVEIASKATCPGVAASVRHPAWLDLVQALWCCEEKGNP